MPLFKSVDLTSPGPIGSTTPNTGKFTTLTSTGKVTFQTATATNPIDLNNGGTGRFGLFSPSAYALSIGYNSGSGTLDGLMCFYGSEHINIPANVMFGFSPNNSATTTYPDVRFYRDSANVLGIRNSTTAQTFRLYRTFTDASNYERLSLIATRTTRFAIAAENAGTGAARSLEISFYTSASDPTSTDITSGCFSIWKNSGTGIVKLWANDGGTMKSVALV